MDQGAGGSPPVAAGVLWRRANNAFLNSVALLPFCWRAEVDSPGNRERDLMAKNIVVAVDAKERTIDALALGRALTEATKTPAVLVTVLRYNPLEDPDSPQMIELRDEARATLLELASSEGLDVAQALVIAGNFAGRELHRLTEQPTTGLIVVGSTTRGPIGRLLVGGIGERLLAGAACPVAIAPRGYGERQPSRLTCIGVGFDGSDEARLALDAAVRSRGPAAPDFGSSPPISAWRSAVFRRRGLPVVLPTTS